MPSLATAFRLFPQRAFTCLAALVLVLTSIAWLSQPAVAGASDDEARAAGSCGRGASSELRVKADDGSIRVRFRVDSNRSRSKWAVALIHEGRAVWQGGIRSDGGGSFDVDRRLRDLPGADQVTARALGPRGITCIAATTLPG